MTDVSHWTRVVEAMLFASATPLPREAIAARLPEDVDPDSILNTLQAAYAPRGVNLVRVAEGWAMRTAPDLAAHLRRAETVERRLSRAALETLAIVAYHQPVTRAEIEGIRGVAVSKGTLDILFETGWIEPRGRRRTPGWPVTWVTTPAFLDHFGLGGLGELPGVDELRAAGLLDPSIGTWQLGEIGDGEDADEDEGEDPETESAT